MKNFKWVGLAKGARNYILRKDPDHILDTQEISNAWKISNARMEVCPLILYLTLMFDSLQLQ